jgi:hypothetical protein
MASYPSNLELYRSIPPNQSSVDSGSHRGIVLDEGGVMIDNAEVVVEEFESRPPAL